MGKNYILVCIVTSDCDYCKKIKKERRRIEAYLPHNVRFKEVKKRSKYPLLNSYTLWTPMLVLIPSSDWKSQKNKKNIIYPVFNSVLGTVELANNRVEPSARNIVDWVTGE